MKDSQEYLFEQIEKAFEAVGTTATWKGEWSNVGTIALIDGGAIVGAIKVNVQADYAQLDVEDAMSNVRNVRVAFTPQGINHHGRVDIATAVEKLVEWIQTVNER